MALCQRCLADVSPTQWRPQKGLDPSMREYCCQNCGFIWYQRKLPPSPKPKLSDSIPVRGSERR